MKYGQETPAENMAKAREIGEVLST